MACLLPLATTVETGSFFKRTLAPRAGRRER
jgi:hypothetical protein